MRTQVVNILRVAVICAFCATDAPAADQPLQEPEGRRPKAAQFARHPVAREHPRLLGSRQRLKQLARERAGAYKRMVSVARKNNAGDHPKMISMALVCAIEGDRQLGKQAVRMAMKCANGPIRRGHVTFGADLARCAIVYDLCHEYWSAEERQKFHTYMNKTVDANVGSETSPFHNAWYSYKNWGYGLACYATYHENPRAKEILATVYKDFITRAGPALEVAGDGGGWAEGYYVNYWTYQWLFFCEVARHCEGVDYYELAPRFFRQRAIASMFETYPTIRKYESRRSIPMGDGGGREFGGDRDPILSSRRILVNRYRRDPAHQAVHAFNETTPRSSVRVYAYKDFLWRDATLKKGDLKKFKLSHFSPGAGYVYARSSWGEDATYFFFKCGDRFTAHQHLDVGNFLIFKHEELIGDGGHYAFGSNHDANYHIRTIAHNTMLVHDPSETWPTFYGQGRGMRAALVTGNDGGQHYPFPSHNGAAVDLTDWKKRRKKYDIADFLAFEDRGSYVYMAGDCTRAYSPKKLELFTRQIVFIRPGTFVIFDRVKSKDPDYKKTWLLQAMKPPTGKAPNLIITNGKGRLFVQTLLPKNPRVRLAKGRELYAYGGRTYPPERNRGPGPECRIQISPREPATLDYFLHVLTAADSSAAGPPPLGKLETGGGKVTISAARARITFLTGAVGGSIEIGGKSFELARKVHPGESLKPVARKASPKKNGKPGPLVAAAPPKPLGPTDAEKAAARKRFAELKQAIVQGARGGKKKRVFVDIAGRTMRAQVVSADNNSIVFSASGLEVPLTWGQLSPKRFYGIARKYSQDHQALCEYRIGMGLEVAAEQEQQHSSKLHEFVFRMLQIRVPRA